MTLPRCGKNIIVSLNQYNLKYNGHYTEDKPRLDIIRIALVSGGIYKHPDCSKEQIARAMMEGLFLNPSAQFNFSPICDFAYDEDVFQTFEIMRRQMSPHNVYSYTGGKMPCISTRHKHVVQDES